MSDIEPVEPVLLSSSKHFVWTLPEKHTCLFSCLLSKYIFFLLPSISLCLMSWME